MAVSTKRASTWRRRRGFGLMIGAALLCSAPLLVACSSKEDTKKSRSYDDDDTPSSRDRTDTPSYDGSAHPTSARRSPPPPSRHRDDPLDEPRPRKKEKSVFDSLTNLVDGLIPDKLKPGGSGDLADAADEVCECKDKACADAVMKRFEKKNDRRKMDELSREEKDAVQRLMECVMKLQDLDSDGPKRARPVPPPSPPPSKSDLDEGGW